MLASIYEDGRVSAMRLFTVENSQPVLGETVYSYSVNDDGEETVTTFGRAYTQHKSTKEYISSTDSVKTKGSLSWSGWTVVNTESESDFFGRTTGKRYNFNFSEDDHPNFGTEYTYADTDTTATNKISRVKNTLNGTVKSDYTYTYDNRGNILTVSKSGVLFQQYVYDEASQVKAEYNYAEHTAMTYIYDANGNIVSKTPYTNVTSSDLSTATQGTVISYGYTDANWSDKLTSYNGQTISYDASGNPTSYKGAAITWNGRLMMSYTSGSCRYEYEYNSDGMRTVRRMYKNSELTSTMRYIWDGDVLLGNRLEIVGSDEPITIRYLYDDSGELYGMDYNGTGYFGFIKNLQGDIVSIIPLDSNSDVQLNMEYDAWGKPIIKQASSAVEGFLMAVMMLVTNVGYRGYFYDFDTGLYYLRSRYYDPEIGRFINADDVEMMIPKSSSMLTVFTNKYFNLNVFSYCQNTPTKDIDDNGKISRSNSDNLATKALVFALFSAAIWDDKIIEIVNGKHEKGIWYKGNITINFVASYRHENICDSIDALVKLYKNEVYDVIAEVALGKFKEQYSYPNPSNERLRIFPHRVFLFSKKCVSNEIQKHFEGFMWGIGKKGYHCPLMFRAYSAVTGVNIKDACEKADILEMGPVHEFAERIGFNYYDGIASVYKKTRKDPYYYPKENKRKRKPNSDWLYIAF